MPFNYPQLGAAYREKMTVIGPNGPEERFCELQRTDEPFGTFVRVPDHNTETERVEHTLGGDVYIIKIK